MNITQRKRLSETWKERLDLTDRAAPELYEEIGETMQCPYASAIRVSLEELGASAVFCVQKVPTIVILVADEYDQNVVTKIHAALWNQGLASLLLVLAGDVVRVFSLDRRVSNEDEDFEDRCLVKKLHAVAEAISLKDLLYGAESGRLWDDHREFFDTKERVDQVLLENLMGSHAELCDDGLSSEAAQALLIQTMFIAYLEDRAIVEPDYFELVTDGSEQSLVGLLESGRVTQFYRLFKHLQTDFNGDLFLAPCAFDLKDPRPRVTSSHMQTMAKFRSGRVLMGSGGGQYQFWGYDFRYIPIELVSAVYDRFLGLKTRERRSKGAYYTPMFLADTVITSVWDLLSEKIKLSGRFVDPACGSGIFMVRCFQLLCEHWRASHSPSKIRWDSLCKLLARLSGYDINGGAVRVAVFSLYVALLQEVNPPDIRRLIGRGRLLPALWGKSLHAEDFFSVSTERLRADVMIGNPPWASRREPTRKSVTWCKEQGLPMPGNEEAWAFVWKSLRHIERKGIVGFLVPAMGFLHNHAKNAVDARRRLIRDSRVFRIVNFSDLRFQLFKGAVRPAALLVIGGRACDAPGYRFDYWTPKSSVSLRRRRIIAIATADKGRMTSREVLESTIAFKRRLWINNAEAKLFEYLDGMPKIGALVQAYGTLVRKRQPLVHGWIVGEGFQPANIGRLDDARYPRRYSELIARSPYMHIDRFRPLAQASGQPSKSSNGLVRSKGFEYGFDGPRILVPRGIVTAQRRLRASYTEIPLTFEHIIQAITVPREDVQRGKLLTALLNSKLMLWFTFHGTASLGAERPELQQAELLSLPFPRTDDLPDVRRSEEAAKKLVLLVDQAMSTAHEDIHLSHGVEQVSDELDHLCYAYFGLGTEEITLVEDTVKYVIPSAQPSAGSTSELWLPTTRDEREAYTVTLVNSMSSWFESDVRITAVLEAKNRDLGLLHLKIGESEGENYRELDEITIGEALNHIGVQLNVQLPGNFQLVPDFRMFDGDSLYLVKPLVRRFWLRSTAIADADSLAAELQHALQMPGDGHFS